MPPPLQILSLLHSLQVETDQPEAGDLFSLIQLWRVMQVLLETTLYESSAYAHKSLGLEQHRKSYSEETDAKLKTLAEELERVCHPPTPRAWCGMAGAGGRQQGAD